MTRGAGQTALVLALLCALITAVSAFITGATIKSLLIRVVISAIFAGATGLIIGSWLHIKLLQRMNEDEKTITGNTVDIEVSDNASAEPEWQPLQVEQISDEDARVFPNRK